MADEPVSKEDAGKQSPVEASKTAPVGSTDNGVELAAEVSSDAVAAAAPATPAPKRRGRPPKAAAYTTATSKPAKVKPAPAKPVVAAPKPAKAAALQTIAAKPKLAKPAKPVSAAPGAAKKSTTVSKAALKTAPVVNAAKPIAVTTPIRKEPSIMDMSANFSTFQDSMAEAQAKAKEAFEKTTGMFGEASEFAKGNVEAMIESGKIFSEGVQEMGTTIAAEGKAAFETMSADMKELAAVKSPTDFLKLQGEMMRKNFDSAVAYGSKNSEAMLKLMSDAMAPLSGRISMAVEKARQAAI